MIPSDPPEPWRRAVRDVIDRVQGSADCRELIITVSDANATMVFVTADDRRAVRAVDVPSALSAVADALLVSVPLGSAAAEAAEVAATSAPASPPVPTAETPAARAVLTSAGPADADRPKADVPPPPRSFVVHASAGARLGFPASYVSPTIGLAVGLSSAWDVWLAGEWDVLSTRASLPAGFARRSIFAAVGGGRRVAIGDVAILGGLYGGVSFDSEKFTTVGATTASTGDNQQGGMGDGQQGPSGDGQSMSSTDTASSSAPASSTEHSTSRVEPRTGIYFGVAFPRRGPIRFRPTLTADVVPSRLGRELSIDPSIPSIPWWSIGLTLGMEGAVR